MKKSAELLVKLISNRTFIYDKELGVHFLSLPFIVIGEQKKKEIRDRELDRGSDVEGTLY